MGQNLIDGMCGFCGQVVQYDEETLKRAKHDPEMAAKLVCDCAEATHFQWRNKAIEKGITNVELVAGKYSEKPLDEEIISYLKRAVASIVDQEIRKMTIQISNQEKITVAVTQKRH